MNTRPVEWAVQPAHQHRAAHSGGGTKIRPVTLIHKLILLTKTLKAKASNVRCKLTRQGRGAVTICLPSNSTPQSPPPAAASCRESLAIEYPVTLFQPARSKVRGGDTPAGFLTCLLLQAWDVIMM